MITDEKICQVAECLDQVHARGWCIKHYRRWYNHGSPTNWFEATGSSA